MPLKKSGGPYVGLDIGSNTIKACEIECKGGRPVLRGITVFPTPAAAVVNNEIVDPVTLGKAIRQALNQAGIRSKQVVTAVAGQSSLVVRIIEVPRMTRAELDETMKWEIERHVPFAAEQTVKAYLPITPPEDVPEGQNMEVLLAVAQESLVNRHLETLQAAGLRVVAIEIEPLATPRALIDISNGAAPAGTVAVVNVGASTTDVGIYREGILAFTRTIQIAGNNLTKAIADTLTKPLQEAEDLKRQRAAVPEQPGNLNQQDDFGGLGPLDFGVEPDEAPLGGTFGVAPSADPGASTASDTHSEATIDVAGSGFSSDAFTSPASEPSPFALPGSEETAPAPNPFAAPPPAAAGSPFEGGAGLFGPAPQGNPFGGESGDLFGPTPQAAPFGLTEDVFGGPPGGGLPGSGTAQMSEEEFLQAQINDAILPVLNELVTELQRSLEFFRNRASGAGAQQILLTGGSARLRGLANFLSANLGIPVAVGDPLQYVTHGPKADPAMVSEYGPAFPVSVGLAVRELLQDPPQARKKR